MSDGDLLLSEYASKDAGYYANARPEMLAFVPPGVRKALDVGCGRGVFGAALKSERSLEVWGVELLPEAAEEAASRLDRVICAPFNDALDLPEGVFDCVIFNDILEHLVDPGAALRYARRLLAPGGVVVASIPNLRYFPVFYGLVAHGRWEYEEQGVMDRTHLRFFTQGTIRTLFAESGYTVRTLEGIRPTPARKWRLVNALLLNRFADTFFPQFAVVAEPDSVAP